MHKLNKVILRSDVKILIQYTKGKSSVHLFPLQFVQNAPEGPVSVPVIENFPLVGGRSCTPPAPSQHDYNPRHQHSQKQGYTTGYLYMLECNLSEITIVKEGKVHIGVKHKSVLYGLGYNNQCLSNMLLPDCLHDILRVLYLKCYRNVWI